MGSDLLQGYLIGKPMAAADIPALLAAPLPPIRRRTAGADLPDRSARQRLLELLPHPAIRAPVPGAVLFDKAE
jgi:hypothetical protein